MPSLSECIKRAGKALQKRDANAISDRWQTLATAGMDSQPAAIQAVQEHLEQLRAEARDLAKTAAAQGADVTEAFDQAGITEHLKPKSPPEDISGLPMDEQIKRRVREGTAALIAEGKTQAEAANAMRAWQIGAQLGSNEREMGDPLRDDAYLADYAKNLSIADLENFKLGYAFGYEGAKKQKLGELQIPREPTRRELPPGLTNPEGNADDIATLAKSLGLISTTKAENVARIQGVAALVKELDDTGLDHLIELHAADDLGAADRSDIRTMVDHLKRFYGEEGKAGHRLYFKAGGTSIDDWLNSLQNWRQRVLAVEFGQGEMDLGEGAPGAPTTPLDTLRARIEQDWYDITDNNALKARVAAAFEIPSRDVSAAQMKQAQEIYEGLLAEHARKRVAMGGDDATIYRELRAMYEQQPLLNVRSSTSMENQAYSTPAPIAFLANRLADVNPNLTVYEPTAGNGMLLLNVDPRLVSANELEPTRAAELRRQGFNVTERDATEPVGANAMDRVIANPPFGRMKDDEGRIQITEIDGYKMNSVDHVIAARSLNAMVPDGSATLILGAGMQTGKIGGAERIFLNWLYSHYNVVSHFEVSGDLYQRQGAGWPIRVITIVGRNATPTRAVAPVSGSIARVGTWDELYERYTTDLGTVSRARQERAAGAVGGAQPAIATGPGPAELPAGGTPEPTAGERGPQRPGSTRAGGGTPGGGRGRGAGSAPPSTGAGEHRPGRGPGEPGGRNERPAAGGPGRAAGANAGAVGGGAGGGLAERGAQLAAEAAKPEFGANNKYFTREMADAADEEILKFLSQSNTGIDPRMMQLLITKVGFYVEAGYRAFSDIAAIMVQKFGNAIAQWLKRAYAGVRGFLGDEAHGMDTDVTIDKWLSEHQAEINRDQLPKGPETEAAPSDFQVPYQSRSSGKNENVLVPVNLNEATQNALADLEAEVGNLDDYVMKKLDYGSRAQLHDAFMGLQVDAVAAAIYNIDNNSGIVVADQTGVGKGRQAAAVLRYARKIGKIPVFFTANAKLFNDMYRDLIAIGETDAQPWLVNQDAVIQPDEEEPPMFGNPDPLKHNATIERVIADGKLPEGKNMLFITYSQINAAPPKSGRHLKRELMARLAPASAFVLDEAHSVAGEQSKKPRNTRPGAEVKDMDRTGAGWMASYIQHSPVMYLSATFAKRADNMPIYYRTDLMDAVDSMDELVAAVAAGGVPLQTVMSNMLAQSGQLFRRERSYAGISMRTVVDYEHSEQHRRIADQATTALRAIVEADQMFHDRFFEIVKQEYEAEGGTAAQAGNQAAANLGHNEFNSVVHNYVKQLLLGLKVITAADKAIEAFRQGKKPVIALENTMGSFLKDYVEQNDVALGDVVTLGYRDVLKRALYRTMRVRGISAQGSKVPVKQFEYSDLDPITRAAYDKALRAIDAAEVDDLPISPIDAIRNRLEAAGMTVDEISGRSLMIDYANGNVLRARRDSTKLRNSTVNRFNNGTLDAMILNGAGSTGLSAHASKDFKDAPGGKGAQWPRIMFVAQPMADINILVQMLGRINRTGQVVVPEYEFLGTDLPAEKRPLANASKKLKKLNANTSANSDSDIGLKAPDMLNKYGDEVINQYLLDNPSLAAQLNVLKQLVDPGTAPPADLMLKVTGRMALLPAADQEAIYADIEEQYEALIRYLNATGQNDLEPRTLDLKAKIEESKIVYEGKKPDSVFGDNTTLHKVSAIYQGKAPTPDDVRERVNANLENRTPQEINRQILAEKAADQTWKEKLKDRYDRVAEDVQVQRDRVEADPENQKARERLADLEENLDSIQAQMNNYDAAAAVTAGQLDRFAIGNRFELDTGDELVSAVVTNIRNTHKPGIGNPYSITKTMVTFAINSGAANGHIEVPLARLTNEVVTKEFPGGPTSRGWDQWVDQQFEPGQVHGTERREIRYVATGNLIAGSAKLDKGKVVNFTDAAGKVHQGILMPKKFRSLQYQALGVAADAVRILDPVVAAKLLRTQRKNRAQLVTLRSSDRTVLLSNARREGEWQLIVPKNSKSKVGNAVKFDAELRRITGDLYGSGKTMSVTFEDSKLDAALRRLMEITAFYADGEFREEVVAAGGAPKPKPVKSFDKGRANNLETNPPAEPPSTAPPEEPFSNPVTPASPEGWSSAGSDVDVMSIGQIYKAIAPMIAGVDPNIGLQVEVVPMAMVPQRVIDRNNGYVPSAWIRDNRVVIVQEYAQSPKHVQVTFAHEVIGHLGIFRVVGDRWPELDAIYRQAKKADPKGFAALDAEVDARYPGLKGVERLAEFIAVLAEKRAIAGPLETFWRKVREVVLSGLRKLGIPVQFSMTDFHRLLTKSERFLATGEGASSIMRDPNAIAFMARPKLDESLYSPTELAVINKVFGTFDKPKSFYERMRAWRVDLKTRLRQGMLDQYDAFRTILRDDRSWMLAHLVKSNTGAMEAAIEHGQLYLDPEGVLAVDVDKKSLKEILAPLGTDLERFLMWIVGNRMQKLFAEGRENLADEFDIDTLMAMNQGREQLFDEVRKEFEAFGDSIVRIGVETGLINEEEADQWRQEGFYLPFYRVLDEESGNRGVRMLDKNGLVRQKAYIRLKGGLDKIKDPLGNALMNWHHLLGASLKNQAARVALNAANQMGVAFRGGSASEDSTVFVRVDGKEQWWTLDNPLVFDALTALNWNGLNGPAMAAMRAFKRALTFGVTLSPEFKVANLLRDSIQAIAVAGISTNIAKNLMQGFTATKEGKTKAQMLAGGAIFAESGYMHGADANVIRRQLARGIQRDTILDSRLFIRRMFDRYQDFGTRLENVNRAANYEQAIADQRGTLRANFEARDQLDFGRTGGWLAVRALTQMIPFLNARMQGLDKLGRAAMDKNQRAQFITVVASYAALSVLLYLTMKDDDDYKQLEEWQRDTYHAFKVPGSDVMYFVPRPFEVGAIASLAERVAEQMVDDQAHGELFANRLMFTLTQTFQVSLIPQMFVPMLEVATNKDAFTQRPIETEGMKNLSPENRKRAWTSQTAIFASQGMAKILWDNVTLSPVQIEELVRGYTGWLGATALALADALISRPVAGAPAQPGQLLINRTRFAHEGPIRNTKYTTTFYDRLDQVTQAWADMRQARLEHNTAKVREIMQERRGELAARQMYNRQARSLTAINHAIQEIYNDPQMDAETKRVRVQALEQKKNALTEQIVKRTDALFQ